MELSIEDVRTLIGSYVLEMLVKDKEIKALKTEIEALHREDLEPGKIYQMKEAHNEHT